MEKPKYIQTSLFDTTELKQTSNQVKAGHLLVRVISNRHLFRCQWWEIREIKDSHTAITTSGVPINFMTEKWSKLLNVTAHLGDELARVLLAKYNEGSEDSINTVKYHLLNIKTNIQND